MLEIKNLRKTYGTKLALNNVSLTAHPGRIYGIVGENGAGKTTFFRCIAGLEIYDGKIKSPYDMLKNHLGYLETTPLFMSYITGWEYLKLICTSKDITKDNFEEQNIFDLPLNLYVSSYSTGMKKKLALMGVLLRKSDIIILDEPFNGVDIQSNMVIIGLIKELKELKKTVLISSHIFSTLRDTCDEIILLSKGEIKKHVHRAEYDDLEHSMLESVLTEKVKKINLS